MVKPEGGQQCIFYYFLTKLEGSGGTRGVLRGTRGVLRGTREVPEGC